MCVLFARGETRPIIYQGIFNQSHLFGAPLCHHPVIVYGGDGGGGGGRDGGGGSVLTAIVYARGGCAS